MRRSVGTVRCVGTALAAISLALTLSVAPARAEVPEAARHAREGQRLFRAGEFERAADEFVAAHAADPAPSFVFNVGLCFERLGRDLDAARHYLRFLELEPASPRADDVRARVAAAESRLGGRLARLEVHSDPAGATVYVDGAAEPLGVTPLRQWRLAAEVTLRLTLDGHLPLETTAPLAPGASSAPFRFDLTAVDAPGRLVLTGAPDGLTVELDGLPWGTTPLPPELTAPAGDRRVSLSGERYLPFETTVTVPPAGVVTVPVALEERPRVERSFEIPWYAWVTGGVAVAGLGVGGAYIGMGVDTANEAERKYSSSGTTPDQDRHSKLTGEAEDEFLIGGLTLGAGVLAGTATGLILWLHNDEPDEDEEGPDVVLLPGPGLGLGLGGSF